MMPSDYKRNLERRMRESDREVLIVCVAYCAVVMFVFSGIVWCLG